MLNKTIKFAFNAISNNTEYENVQDFRDSATVIFLFFAAVLFFAYGLSYLITGDILFGIIKFLFGATCILLLYYKKYKSNQHLTSVLFGLLITFYAIVAMLDGAEKFVGFIWSFFVPPLFIFLLGYKKGTFYAIIASSLILCVGFYDASFANEQFLSLINFFVYVGALVAFIVIFMFVDFLLSQLEQKLLSISSTDPLTKIYNRRKIDESLREELSRGRDNNFSISILDIDDFKKINDTNGHLVGDEVLKIFAQTLQNSLRKTDIIGRWGGEEFMIILPNTDINQAYECIKKVQENLKTMQIGQIKSVKCSFGIASTDGKLSFSELILKADKALYKAKATGKDKIILSED